MKSHEYSRVGTYSLCFTDELIEAQVAATADKGLSLGLNSVLSDSTPTWLFPLMWTSEAQVHSFLPTAALSLPL
jgi:hypothetical protein